MKKLRNIHPGEILSKEFLNPMGLTRYRLSRDTGLLQTSISSIIRGRKKITPETALKLSRYFGTSAKFWLDLQRDFDMKKKMSS